MPRVLDGGHGPHQAAARCVGTSRTDLGIAIVLVCSALRAGWSAGAATRCLKVTVYAFYATGARSNSSATRPDMAGWAANLSGLLRIDVVDAITGSTPHAA